MSRIEIQRRRAPPRPPRHPSPPPMDTNSVCHLTPVPDALTSESTSSQAALHPLDSARVVERLGALSLQETINRLSNDRHVLSLTNAKLRTERDWFKERFEAAFQDRRLFESESMLMMEEWLQDRKNNSPPRQEMPEESRRELGRVKSENNILTKQVEVLAKALSDNMSLKEQAESQLLTCKQQMAMEQMVQAEAIERQRAENARLQAQLHEHLNHS